MNQVLSEEAAADPDLHVVDWDGARQPGWTGSDGLHLTAAGATGMATLILQQLDAWHATEQCVPRPDTNPPATPSTASASGYWLLDSDRARSTRTARPRPRRPRGHRRSCPPRCRRRPSGDGYWIVDQAGGVHAFGDAQLARRPRAAPPQRARPAHRGAPRRGRGYWLVASDGGVFAFGVPFLGSMGATPPEPARDLDARHGRRRRLLARRARRRRVLVRHRGVPRLDGRARVLNAPVISMAVDAGRRGLLAVRGRRRRVLVRRRRSTARCPGTGLCGVAPTVAMRASAHRRRLLGGHRDGSGVRLRRRRSTYGDQPALAAGARVVDMAVRR